MGKLLDRVVRNFRGIVSPAEQNHGRPVEGMAGAVHPPSIQEMIQQYIRVEMSNAAKEEGNETFEEADDFDVGIDDEDVLPLTHHEVLGMDDDELAAHAHHYGVDLMEDSQGSGPPSSGSSGGDNPSIPAEGAPPT